MKYFWIVFVTGKCSLLVVLLRQSKLNLQEKFMRALLPFKESQWMTRNSLHLGTSHNGRMVSQQHNAGPRSLAHTLPMRPLFFNHIASLSPLTLFQYLKCGLVHRTLRNFVESNVAYKKTQGVLSCLVKSFGWLKEFLFQPSWKGKSDVLTDMKWSELLWW